MTATNFGPRLYLRTFGAPHLLAHSVPFKLRAKDLALLVYLRLQQPTVHRRTRLAALLWAEHSEHDARHSLTQAVVRLRKVLGAGSIVTTKETVQFVGRLECDAAQLQEAARRDEPGLLELYAGEFLAGLSLGEGAHDFDNWASARRTEYRELAAGLLDRWGAAAEERGDWPAALRFAQRQVEIDEYDESGHRRAMRAFEALGQRNRALLHYMQYAARVLSELGLKPEDETTALYEKIRRSAGPDSPGPPDSPDPPDPPDPPEPGPSLPGPWAGPAPAAPEAEAGGEPREAEPDGAHPARRRWLVPAALAAGLALAWAATRGGPRLHL
ncbi:MAG TPA: BTAD domain-containing putative transcriptional regulator [Longimicrobium sp.]|jgi:DNA-binding SARP family transcriptional activator